jgi:citrate lyase gamma subunit
MESPQNLSPSANCEGGSLKIKINFWVLVVLILTVSVVQAGSNPTPEEVMTVAKQGSIESADIFIVVNEANSFLNRLSSDKSYATKFQEAIEKNDSATVVSIVKQTAPRCQVSVAQLKAIFFAVVDFKIKTRIVTVCLSGENTCAGHASTVTIK